MRPRKPVHIDLDVHIAAPVQVVFDAFTDDIALWWKPNGLFAFTPRSPGVMAFEEGRLVERLASGKVFEVGKGWREADADVCEAELLEIARYEADRALALCLAS